MVTNLLKTLLSYKIENVLICALGLLLVLKQTIAMFRTH